MAMPSELSYNRRIVGYLEDTGGHWVAQLECGHRQHLRHLPPWINRPWVLTRTGRDSRLGATLRCKLCDGREPQDATATSRPAPRLARVR